MTWLRDRREHLIGGAWVADTGPVHTVVSPSTEKPVAVVPRGAAPLAVAAVDAAEAARPRWATTPVPERIALVERLAERLAAAEAELATVIATEVGMPRHLAGPAQVGVAVANLRATAAAAAAYPWRAPLGAGEAIREPAGVAVAITPWNMPLHQIAAKVGPALVAGPVVLKPSEVTPLSAFAFADCALAAGVPDGVLNLVCGPGAELGEALVADPRVAVVSLTGSGRSGARVAVLAAPNITRVCLELGGKSANVLLGDAPLEVAVPAAVQQAFFNSGQACNALTRLLVPQRLGGEVAERLVEAVGRLRVGDPFDETSDLGPLISDRQRSAVRAQVTGAVAAGARLLAGGAAAPDHLPVGFYHRPTVLDQVEASSRLAREEVFGPVLAVLAYPDSGGTDAADDAAVRLANDSDYGLAAGVWSAEAERARAVGRRLVAGQVKVNGVRTRDSLDAPFGGYRRSGLGRELGRFGIDEYVEIKALLG